MLGSSEEGAREGPARTGAKIAARSSPIDTPAPRTDSTPMLGGLLPHSTAEESEAPVFHLLH